MTLSRRDMIRKSAALGLLSAFVPARAMAQGTIPMPMGVGTHTNGGPLVIYMQENGLIEKASEAIGIDVAPEFQDFQALLRMLQGVAAGQLQYGMLGSTPLIRLLATPNPAVPIAIAGGGLDFPVQVPPDSPIRNMEDMRGKTVLTIVGSDLHLQWVNMLKAHFGTSDASEVGITMKNITAVTELWEAQPGIDAVVGLNPGSFGAEERGVLETLITNYGTTGKHYEGPEGSGAGHTLDWFSNAQFAPEAFYPHRIWWAVRQQFMQEHPQAVTAFLVANQQAAGDLSSMQPQQVTKIIGDHWPQSASIEARNNVVEVTLWYRRGWSWITEGDARTLVGLSEEPEIFETALSADLVKGVLGAGADVTLAAYEQGGRVPPAEVFTDPDAKDVRGLPQWQIDEWSL